MIKRIFTAVVGLVLVIGGASLFVREMHWVLDLLLGGAMATGVGLMIKALLGEDEK